MGNSNMEEPLGGRPLKSNGERCLSLRGRTQPSSLVGFHMSDQCSGSTVTSQVVICETQRPKLHVSVRIRKRINATKTSQAHVVLSSVTVTLLSPLHLYPPEKPESHLPGWVTSGVTSNISSPTLSSSFTKSYNMCLIGFCRQHRHHHTQTSCAQKSLSLAQV